MIFIQSPWRCFYHTESTFNAFYSTSSFLFVLWMHLSINQCNHKQPVTCLEHLSKHLLPINNSIDTIIDLAWYGHCPVDFYSIAFIFALWWLAIDWFYLLYQCTYHLSVSLLPINNMIVVQWNLQSIAFIFAWRWLPTDWFYKSTYYLSVSVTTLTPLLI